MAQCVVCGEEFSRNPLAKHFRVYTCGLCGGAVGDGCYERKSNELGHDTVTCRTCLAQGKTSSSPDDPLFSRSAVTLSAKVRDAGIEVLDEAEKRLAARVDQAEERLRSVSQEVLSDAERRAEAFTQKQLSDLETRARKLKDEGFGQAHELAEKTVRETEEALQRLAREEVRLAVYLALAMAGLVAVSGAVSLLFAWLHRFMAR